MGCRLVAGVEWVGAGVRGSGVGFMGYGGGVWGLGGCRGGVRARGVACSGGWGRRFGGGSPGGVAPWPEREPPKAGLAASLINLILKY